MKRTKIVCTAGPANNDYDTLAGMVMSGMDAVRLNFSHGTHTTHAEVISLIRRVSEDTKRYVTIIGDLQGPKIRVKLFKDGGAAISAGQEFTITTDDILGNEHGVSTGFAELPTLVGADSDILLDDGKLQMRVKSVKGNNVICEVITGGILKDNKGINLPGISSGIKAVTEKDERDLDFAIANGVDFIAVSFVRRAEDIELVREKIEQAGKSTRIIAKLEKPEAIANLDAIIDTSDGVMIARGDLGVEINPEKVPVLQKDIIKRAIARGKFVITATQMLDSMTEHPRPTRAEASDVANAIFDGSDALMLSAETAVGKYPVESVRMMTKIINEVENSTIWGDTYLFERHERTGSFSRTIASAAKTTAYELSAKAISAFTMSGYTGRLISNVRPKTPIVCFTTDERVVRELKIYWGINPIKIDLVNSLEEVLTIVESELLTRGIAEAGDVVIIICGIPIISSGETNLLKAHIIRGSK